MGEMIATAEEEKKLLEDELKRTRKEVAEGKAEKSASQELAAQIADFAVPRFPRLLISSPSRSGLSESSESRGAAIARRSMRSICWTG